MNYRILEGFSKGRIQIIAGQRGVLKYNTVQTAVDFIKKHTGIEEHAIFTFDLDDILIRLNFEENFDSFQHELERAIGHKLESISLPTYLIFNQVENARNLFPFIAKLKTINPQHIRIMLTSSIDLRNDPDYATCFSFMADIHSVYPPTLGDVMNSRGITLPESSTIASIANGQIDRSIFAENSEPMKDHRSDITAIIKEYLLNGGQHLIDNVSESVRLSLKDYYENILLAVYQLTELKKFDQILRILASQNGNMLNLLKMCDTYNINRNTMRKYSGILVDTFMIDYVHPFLKARVDKPIMRSPKIYFYDNGLVNHLNGIDSFDMLENANGFQSNLDAMLYANLKAIMADDGKHEDIKFLRDYQNHELDFLLNTPNGLVPVGICMDADTRKEKIKTFRYYLRYCQQIYHGIIFTNQDEIECIDMKKSKLYLLPLWMMW
ncbi:ATP-binding protein [candidate division KSB1 bacterium]|nr:ATP-binding protein [candidate division KSB1 bacterium]